MMTVVGDRLVRAVRMARSMRERKLFGHVDFDQVIAGDVAEKRLQVDFLLIAAAHRAALGLADDRDHAARGRAWRRRGR